MKNLIFILLVSFSVYSPVNAAVEWLGGNGDWEDASLWNTGQLPGPGDDVLLTSGKITLNSAVTVRSLDVQHQASFVIEDYARLTILPVAGTTYPFIVYGKVTIEGTVQVLDQLNPWTGTLVQVYGSVQAEGGSEVTFSGGGLSVFQNGIYNNRGMLEVQDMVGFAFTIEGVLLNRGTINAVGDGTNGGLRIYDSGQFVNHRNITLEDFHTAIENSNRIYNTRNITLINCSSGIRNYDLIDNRYAGLIYLEDMNISHAVYNTDSGEIRNRGRIQVVNSDGANGLRNFGEVTNYSSGRIDLSGPHLYELLKNDDGSYFANYGRIDVRPSSSNILQGGLRNSGDFINHTSGTIVISGRFDKGLYNVENFTNQGALTVSNVYPLALFNEGVFTNAACGEITLHKRFENHSSGVWLNDSWLRLTSNYPSVNNGFFQNTATIEDIKNTLNNAGINNDGAIARGFNGIVYTGMNSNVLDLGSANQIDISYYFYDEPGGNEMGVYDVNNNTLNVFMAAEGLKALYFEAELLGYGCREWFVMEIPDAIQFSPNPFTSTPGNPVENVVPAHVNVYPNPSQGQITINWPNDIAETVAAWSIINLQGREVAAGEVAQRNVDLTALPAATYLLRRQDQAGNWKLVDRIILQ